MAYPAIVSVNGRMGTGKSSACRLIQTWSAVRAWRVLVIATGDIARSLPPAPGGGTADPATGLHPQEDVIRRRLLRAIDEQHWSADIILLDGAPRYLEQAQFLHRSRWPPDTYVFLSDARGPQFYRQRAREDGEYAAQIDFVQAQHLAAVHSWASAGLPVFNIDGEGKSVVDLALLIDRIGRDTYERLHPDPYRLPLCNVCSGSGFQTLRDGNYEELGRCGFCRGHGRAHANLPGAAD